MRPAHSHYQFTSGGRRFLDILDRAAGTQGGLAVGTILLIVLVFVLLATIPTWPYSRSWSYYPSTAVGLLLLLVIAAIFLRYL
jgi:protein-S-isoprenylcysteine O-methyltransferase Ste14